MNLPGRFDTVERQLAAADFDPASALTAVVHSGHFVAQMSAKLCIRKGSCGKKNQYRRKSLKLEDTCCCGCA